VKSAKSLLTNLYSETSETVATDWNSLFCRFRPFKTIQIILGRDFIFMVYGDTRSNGSIDELERIWKEATVA
jgi:hypothetical protein